MVSEPAPDNLDRALAPRLTEGALWGITAASLAAWLTIWLQCFHPGFVVAAAGLTTGGLILRRRIAPSHASASGSTWAAATATLLAAIPLFVSLWVGAEPYLGRSDGGVYLASGVTLSRAGRLAVRPNGLDSIPADFRSPFISRERTRVGSYERDPLPSFDAGFPLDAAGNARPQFPPLWSSWLGTVHALTGLRGVLLLPAVLTGAALLLLRDIVARAFGDGPALLTTLLVAVSPLTLWFAREMLAVAPLQLLVLAAVWSLQRTEITASRSTQVLGGMLVGLACGIKLTGMLFLPGVVLFAIWRRRWLTLFAIISTVGLALGLAVWATPSYMAATGWQAWHLIPRPLASPGIVLGLAAVALLMVAAIPALWTRLPRRVQVGAPTLGLLLYAAWLVLIRPPVPLRVTLHSEDATNVLQLAWYLTPLVPALALTGALLAVRTSNPLTLAILLPLGFEACLLLVNNAAPNTHPWVLKRYAVSTVPLLLLLAASAIWRLGDRIPRGGRPTSWVLTVAIASASLLLRPELAFHPQLKGLTPVLKSVESALPRDALLVAGHGAQGLAVPLWTHHGRDTTILFGQGMRELLLARRGLAAIQDRPLYYLSEADPGLGTAPSLEIPLDLSTLRQVKDAPAGRLDRHQTTLRLFRVPPLEATPRRLSMGGELFGLVDGLYPTEPNHPNRWTSGMFRAWVWKGPGNALCVRAAGHRPPGSPPARITIVSSDLVLANDQLLPPRMTELSFPLPSNYMSPMLVTVISSTFVPALHQDSADLRELGVLLHELRSD